MPRLIWSRQTLLDVQRLHRFLIGKNSVAAQRAVQALRNSVQMLARQPALGRPIDELPETFREWVIDFGDRGYVARSRIDADVVVILTVGHQEEAGFIG